MSYFNVDDKLAPNDISCDILKNYGREKPVLICLGTSKVLADMVGVFVADILKERGADIFIFGGSKRNIDKQMAKYISKQFDATRLLFVDSGILASGDKIAMSPILKLNNGGVIKSTSIIAGTVQMQNGKINLTSKTLNEVLHFAQVIADGICDYLSYLELLEKVEK